MNTDIRLSVLFLDHPKTIKLRRRLGFAGVESLIRLWCWTAQNKPDGDLLCMDADDIEIAARWEGEGGAFIGELVSLRWLDRGESSGYRLHDWQVHNPWAANAEDRGNKARLSRLARVDKDLYSTAVTEGKTGLTRIEYESLTNRKRISNDPVTPAPAPAPAPSPAPKTHKEKPMSKEKAGETSQPIGKDVDVVFSYWKEKLKHPQAQLGGKRKVIIAARIKEGYTVDALKEAIDGCSKSPYHQGKNDSNMVYDSIELICRDAEHVDRFRKIACMGACDQTLTDEEKWKAKYNS